MADGPRALAMARGFSIGALEAPALVRALRPKLLPATPAAKPHRKCNQRLKGCLNMLRREHVLVRQLQRLRVRPSVDVNPQRDGGAVAVDGDNCW